MKLERDPITDHTEREHLRKAVEKAQRRITTRDFIATSRDDPFDQLPGTPYTSIEEDREYKEQLLRDSTALLEAGQMEDAITKLLEIYKVSNDDEPALEALRDLVARPETDEPSAAFAKIRFAIDGIRLAEEYEREELRERFERELEDAWQLVDEQFVGARYLHRESGLPMLVLDVTSRRVDDGGVVLTATVQWGGDIDMENAHAMAATEGFELLESGESRDLQADACAERNHDFEKGALERDPLRAICSQCGLSGEAIQYLLNHDFPEVCDDCGAVDYDVVYQVAGEGEGETGRCPDCR